MTNTIKFMLVYILIMYICELVFYVYFHFNIPVSSSHNVISFISDSHSRQIENLQCALYRTLHNSIIVQYSFFLEQFRNTLLGLWWIH